MNRFTKGILAAVVLGATMLVVTPEKAEAHRWACGGYGYGGVYGGPGYYPIYARRAYRPYYPRYYARPYGAYRAPVYYGGY